MPALAAGGKAGPVDTGGTKEQPDPWLVSRLASSCLDALLQVVSGSGDMAEGVERESMMCWNMMDMAMSIHRMPMWGFEPVAVFVS